MSMHQHDKATLSTVAYLLLVALLFVALAWWPLLSTTLDAAWTGWHTTA